MIWLLVGCSEPEPTPAPAGCEAGAVVVEEHRACNLKITLGGAEGEIPAWLTWRLGHTGAWLGVAVVAQGGADTLAEAEPPITPTGWATVQPAPWAESWGDGRADSRGANARTALAAAIRYAAGWENDAAGQPLTTTLGGADIGLPFLVGLSNGGNLAVQTLAQHAADLPSVGGLLLWETPAGASFVNKEHGNSLELYEPGACTLGADGIACPFARTDLASTSGAACFDLDANGECGDGDVAIEGSTNPVSGLESPSPALAALLEAAGIGGFDTEADARAFWSERDAAQAAGAMVAAHPELPVMLAASEVDHGLSGLPDHPHVVGLYQALNEAGAGWIRLNPGAADLPDGAENSPGAAISLDDPEANWASPTLPRDELLAAALAELAEQSAE